MPQHRHDHSYRHPRTSRRKKAFFFFLCVSFLVARWVSKNRLELLEFTLPSRAVRDLMRIYTVKPHRCIIAQQPHAASN